MRGRFHITKHARQRAAERVGEIDWNLVFARAAWFRGPELRARLNEWQQLNGWRKTKWTMLDEKRGIAVLDKQSKVVLILKVVGIAHYVVMTVYKMPTSKQLAELREAKQKLAENS